MKTTLSVMLPNRLFYLPTSETLKTENLKARDVKELQQRKHYMTKKDLQIINKSGKVN